VGSDPSPLDQPNTHGPRTYLDTTFPVDANIYFYRVAARNTIGYGGEFMSLSAESASDPVYVVLPPTNLVAALQAGPTGPWVGLTWLDNTANEAGFAIERATNGGAFVQIATAPAGNGTGAVRWVDQTVATGTTYTYRVAATSTAGPSPYSNNATVVVPVVPAVPTDLLVVNGANGTQGTRSQILTWTADQTNVTSWTVQRARNASFTQSLVTYSVTPASLRTLNQTGLLRNTDYFYRIRANNGTFVYSAWLNGHPFPLRTRN